MLIGSCWFVNRLIRGGVVIFILDLHIGTYVPGFGAAKFEPCLSSHWEGAMNCPLLGNFLFQEVRCFVFNKYCLCL